MKKYAPRLFLHILDSSGGLVACGRRRAPTHYGMVNPRPRNVHSRPRPAAAGPSSRGGGGRQHKPRAGGLDAIFRRWWLILALIVAGFVLLRVSGYLAEIPLPEAAPGAQSSKLYDARGELIYTFHGTENRTIVPLDAISPNLKQAVVAAEDRAFYTHPGVSMRGIARAAFSNVREGEIGQGASTITQQYARTFATVGKERTFARKLREATLAVKIERVYSKDKILEFYLNTCLLYTSDAADE